MPIQNGLMLNGSPFKPYTSAPGSMFSLNRKLKSKDVSIAPKYNDASQRTKMLAINAQKPKKSMQEKGAHQSEWDWLEYDYDVTINNNGTLQELHEKVDDLIISNKIAHTPSQLSHTA